MLLAVGGESRRIVLGEVPPVQAEQEQEPAQDVAAQWRVNDNQEPPVPAPRRIDSGLLKKRSSLSKDRLTQQFTVTPALRPAGGDLLQDEKRRANSRNCKSRRRRVFRLPGNHSLVTSSRIDKSFICSTLFFFLLVLASVCRSPPLHRLVIGMILIVCVILVNEPVFFFFFIGTVSGSASKDDTNELVTTPKSSRRESGDTAVAPKYQPRRLIMPPDFKVSY